MLFDRVHFYIIIILKSIYGVSDVTFILYYIDVILFTLVTIWIPG